jgi:uncharacterized protein (TIGR03086 family)
MGEIADRYRRVADGFGARVSAVDDGAWDNPAPCEGWVARDVVGHLTSWLPGFFYGTWGIDAPNGPDVADDPAGAWAVLDATLRAALADPDVATAVRDTPMGPSTFESTLDTIATPDILIHTWDLARATGLDERLDPTEVHRWFEGMDADDTAMRESGHYGPRVEAPEGADEQAQVLAYLGRLP